MNAMLRNCCIASLIYFILMIIALSNTSCGMFSNGEPTVDINKIINCTKVIQECIANIQEAKQTEDPMQIILATGNCNEQIVQNKCIDLIKEIKDGQNSGNN